MLKLKCKDVGFKCGFVAKGKTEDEIMQKAAEHAMKDHGMKPEDKATEKTMVLNIERLLAGKKIEKDFDPSIGCSIKWKSQQT